MRSISSASEWWAPGSGGSDRAKSLTAVAVASMIGSGSRTPHLEASAATSRKPISSKALVSLIRKANSRSKSRCSCGTTS